ncbi:MAG: L-threonine 3-dehydrogenase [Akkermansiaceae bacterium]|nr:L-threonine 3-dehydrogenase [Akkermansiaceae bacterium]
MKALVKTKADKGLELIDVPMPEVGVNDVLIKIYKTAICGTDLHIWNWDPWAQQTIPVGMHVGHEFCGVIERVGSAVTEYKPGDVVSGEGHIVCGHCRNCRKGLFHLCPNTKGVGVNREGCFAEYLCIPQNNVIRIHKDMPMEIASILDPLGNATHTALSWDLVGEDVLITGAGLIGSMAAAVCKKAGAKSVTITDVSDYKLNLARIMGADRTVNVISGDSIAAAREDLEIAEGYGVCLEMSGAPACLKDIITHSAYGANISLLGIQPGGSGIDWNTFVWKGLKMKGIYGREMFGTWQKMDAMLRSGLDVSPIITHRLHYTDFKEGFEVMNSGKSGKVVLTWAE